MAGYIFTFALFCSAFLLFLIQPMAAKAILPVYGGSPGVWTICMLFFQLLLWLAYGYSWLITSIRNGYLWRIIHLIVFIISFSAIPMMLSHLHPGNNPELAILKTLIRHLLLPMLMIASSAPLLQYAYSQTALKQAQDPYFLYGASNLGSLLALLLYPFFIERFSNLTTQFWGWNIGYVFYFICIGFCFFAIPYHPTQQLDKSKPHAISSIILLFWLLLSFIPCSLMLGVTLYVTSDIAATPLLWIIPLALYLLSFVLTFQTTPWIKPTSIGKYLLFILFFPLMILFGGPIFFKTWQSILLHFVAFFALALYCHGRLYQSRPSTQHLTLFYFCIASGGVLAGLFNGIIAPIVFSDVYEYPLILIISLAFLTLKPKRFDWLCPAVILILLLADYVARAHTSQPLIINGKLTCLILLAALFIWQPRRLYMIASLACLAVFTMVMPNNGETVLAKQRNFFGVKKIIQSGDMHILFNHTTVHGFEVMTLKQQNGRQSYYAGASDIIHMAQQRFGSLKTTIIGLGTGMMTCQFGQSDQLTLIDIDPQVIEIAKNNQYFTFLNDCASHANIVLGDGRISVKQLKQHSQDLIILDAFNSDAIPIHLLTLEAVQQYQRALANHGMILIHISNRHINLLPVITAIGRQLELVVLHQQHPSDLKQYQLSSEWVILTRDEPLAERILNQPYWHFVAAADNVLWKDSFASVISVLK